MIQLQPDFFVAFDLYPTFSNCTLNPAMVFLGFKVSPCFALHLGSRCQACPLALRPPQRPSPMVAGASNRSCWESNIKPPIGSICWWFLEPIYGKFGGGSYCFTHIYTHIYIYYQCGIHQISWTIPESSLFLWVDTVNHPRMGVFYVVYGTGPQYIAGVIVDKKLIRYDTICFSIHVCGMMDPVRLT